MNKVNVLFDQQVFWQKYGGISRVFYELITRIAKYERAELDIFMGVFENRYGLENFRDDFRNFWGRRASYPTRQWGALRRFMNNRAWSRFKMQTGASGRGDFVYHPTYYDFDESVAGKKVFTVHDFTHEKAIPATSDHTIALKKRAFENASGLICISESTKRDFLDLYGENYMDRIKVIHHGYTPMGAMLNAKVPLPRKPYLLHVGGRDGYKNFICTVRAYAGSVSLRKDFKLVCFGSGPFSTSERSIFAELGIADDVLYFSGGDDVLATLYKNARVFVYPSLYEGFGLPLLEAMSCHCPVIAADATSFPEVASDAAAFFDPSSDESLSETLTRVAYDECEINALKVAGESNCAKFSWDKCARETYAFYKKVCSA